MRRFKKTFLFFSFLIAGILSIANPVISDVKVEAVYGTSAVITWKTDVPSTSRVTYGTSIPPSTNEDDTEFMVTDHVMVITNLSTCTPYYFSVSSNDGEGTTVDDNNGNYYTFKTGLDTEVTYSANNLSLEILPGTYELSTIYVSEDREIEDIDLTIQNLEMAYPFFLEIYLIAPDNTRVLLARWHGECYPMWGEPNYTGTIFDDEAYRCIGDYINFSPFTGRFKPLNGFKDFLKGKRSQGNWSLEVHNHDLFYQHTATLQEWNIHFYFGYRHCEEHLKLKSFEIIDQCTGTGNGNNNGFIEAGEDISLPITLFNDGNANLTGISAYLTTTTQGVTITNGSQSSPISFPNLNQLGEGVSNSPFQFSVDVSKSCGDEIEFNLHIIADQKQSGWDIPITFKIGEITPSVVYVLDEDFSRWDIQTNGWTIIDGGYNDDAPPEAYTWSNNYPGKPQGYLNNYECYQGQYDYVEVMYPIRDPFMMVNSDYAGLIATQDEELITPSFDLTDAITVTLEFDHSFYFYCGNETDEKTEVDIRSSLTNNEWVNLYSRDANYDCEYGDGYGHMIYDITQYAAGATDVQIRFHYYDAQWDLYWIIDNVKLYYTTYSSCNMERCCPEMTKPNLSFEDLDHCSTSGIKIYFTSAVPSTRHDLYVDGQLYASNVTSPYTYYPNDNNEHTFRIRAVNYYEDCYVESNDYYFVDENKTPDVPANLNVVDISPCLTSGLSISWQNVSNATHYDLLVDGGTSNEVLIQNVTSPYLYEPNDNQNHTFKVRAKYVSSSPEFTCYSNWSSQIVGTDENKTPSDPTSSPSVSDIDSCQTNGVRITWSSLSGANAYDLRVDGTTIISNVVSPYDYNVGDNNVHTYEIRGKYVSTNPEFTCYSNWSPAQNGTDINDTPGAPVIISITDNDPCQTNGITISFNYGNGAQSHDLYKDGQLVVSNFTSGSTYEPGDNLSHNYVIRAKRNACYTDSTPVSGTDINDTPGTPVITQIVDNDPCSASGIKIYYNGGSGAQSHDLYRDGQLVVSNYVSGAIYQPGDTIPHIYVIKAKKNLCYTNSSSMFGTDIDDTPGQPVITSIVDNDECSTSGIKIYYTAGGMAQSHDLYSDGQLVVSNYVSGSNYYPNDNNPHNYVIRAKNNTCYNDSSPQQGVDNDFKPSTPSPPVVSDLDACATSGVQVSWGSASQATSYDLLIDNSILIQDVSSPYTYYPNDNASHIYKVRGKNSYCEGDWSQATSATDFNYSVGTPSISVNDYDVCQLNGVQILWDSVDQATAYDLRVDNSVIINNVSSPYIYQPGDSSSHSYEVRGRNSYCTGSWSTPVQEEDENLKPDAPRITSIIDINECSTNGVSITYSTVTNATYYDLLVDGSTLVQNITNPYTYTPNDNSTHYYQVRGRNADCDGFWSISTSYTNTGGSGDRTSIITVTSNTLFGTLSQLVDGVTNSSNVYFTGGSVVGKYIQFDFGSLQVVINEAKMYQTSSATHGTWKWQGSTDGTTWVDIGLPFTLGGATQQFMTSLNNNSNLYRYYRLTGVSGNSNSGPYILEFEFRINSQIIGEAYIDINNSPGTPVITSIVDDNECAESGIKIYYTAGSGATRHDLYKDGNLAVSNYISGDIYKPYDQLTHSYVIRAVYGSCYTDSSPVEGVDQATTVGEPVITSIVDNDYCAQNGIRVYYTPGDNAQRHDLYKDGLRVVVAYSSGALYNPGDTNSHRYYVRAVNATCYNNSSEVPFTDQNYSMSTPSITSVSDINICANDGVRIEWQGVSGATYYDLLVDGSTQVNNVTSPYTYIPNDNNSHTYQIRARNDYCTSSWSSGVSGTDINYTPSTISLSLNDVSSDNCGIEVLFSGGNGATQFDLYVDSQLKVQNITSGYIYQAEDGDTHTYFVRGFNSNCYIDSNTQQIADPNCGTPPPEVAPGNNINEAQVWGTNKTTHSWPSVPNANGYRVYRGTKTQLPDLLNNNPDFCLLFDTTSTSVEITENPETIDSTYRCCYYIVVAYNGAGEGPAGPATAGERVLNSSGNCP